LYLLSEAFDVAKHELANLLLKAVIKALLLYRGSLLNLQLRFLDVIGYDFLRFLDFLANCHSRLSDFLAGLCIDLVATGLREKLELVDSREFIWFHSAADDLPAQFQVSFIAEIDENCVGAIPIIPLNFAS